MVLLERLRGLVGRTVGVPDREEDPMVSAPTAQTRKLAHGTAPDIVQAPGNGEQHPEGWPSDAPRELNRDSRNSDRLSFWRAIEQVLSEGEEVCVQYEGCGFRVTGIAGDAKRPMLRLQGRSSAIPLLGTQSIRYTGSILEKGDNGRTISPPTVPPLSTRRNDRVARGTAKPVDMSWTTQVSSPLTPEAEPFIRSQFCAVLQRNARGHVIEVDGQLYRLDFVNETQQGGDWTIKVRDADNRKGNFQAKKVTLRYASARLEEGQELAVLPGSQMDPALSELLDRTITAVAENRRLVALAAAQAAAKATTEGTVPGKPTLPRVTRLGIDSTEKDIEAFCAPLKPDISVIHFQYDRKGGERTGYFLSQNGTSIGISTLNNNSLSPKWDDIWVDN